MVDERARLPQKLLQACRELWSEKLVGIVKKILDFFDIARGKQRACFLNKRHCVINERSSLPEKLLQACRELWGEKLVGIGKKVLNFMDIDSSEQRE